MIQNPKPQTCRKAVHTSVEESVCAEWMIALMKVNIHPYSNDFEWFGYLFSWGSEYLQKY